ncbi:PREDICTED: uncharacterized protein LOC105569255 [Vollenhovia emeryi]|uniref:uncharacterized protein LOC105569255 n=1 Tax=Vollenhovia emeryi TaxID=411798 RepID=UPI0005F50639|nr:PREDICTED: uncharacterized protein LOC105569255 [Vollenhovia emeryi]
MVSQTLVNKHTEHAFTFDPLTRMGNLNVICCVLSQESHLLKHYLFLDSSFVELYCWHNLPTSRQWTPFVANRVAEIQRLTNIDSWRHVSSQDNAADPLSRGIMPNLLSELDLWWHGPFWLKCDNDEWPSENFHTSDVEMPEMRLTAMVIEMGNKPSEEEVDKVQPLSMKELERSRVSLVKMIQHDFFKTELHSLRSHGYVAKNSNILNLNPFIDAHGILRVGGRLRHAIVSYDHKHPVLLPGKHAFTRLIIIDEHERQLHAGAQATLSANRQNYWPTSSARSVIRSVIKKCTTCIRNTPKLGATLMADLPETRVNIAKYVFKKCGVDYAGPLWYKEVDVPRICTDNGLNFIGANRELNELYDLFNNEVVKQKIGNFATSERMNWHFIPPRSPHMGGLWEAAIKSAKFHLKRIVGEASLKYQELNTVLIQIEAVLNSRPLTPLSNDPNDFNALTPAHFLIGCPITTYPEPSLKELQTNRLSRWQRVEQLRQHFWQRWVKEYLHNCQSRVKWNEKTDPIKVGQMVILKEDNLPPLCWSLGRIEQVYPGKDNIIRVVSV